MRFSEWPQSEHVGFYSMPSAGVRLRLRLQSGLLASCDIAAAHGQGQGVLEQQQ